MGANAGRGLSPIIGEIRVLKCDIAVMGCRKGTLGHDDTTATLACDAVTVLKIPQNFAPLRLFRRGCGILSFSVLLAKAEWCRTCAPAAPRQPTA